MSATTRSRMPTGSSAWPVSWGPSSPMTSMWIEFLMSANGSFCGAAETAGLVVTRRSWSSMRYFLLKRNRDRVARSGAAPAASSESLPFVPGLVVTNSPARSWNEAAA